MKNLILHVRHYYFVEMREGRKPFEYRLITPYWRKRIEGRNYSAIVIYDAYPKLDEVDKILVRTWNGYEVQTITHPHFGALPVEVFAIRICKI